MECAATDWGRSQCKQTSERCVSRVGLANFARLCRGNVVDLAIGIIIGAAFTGVVGSLVKDVINPVIGLIIGGVDFSNIFVALRTFSDWDCRGQADPRSSVAPVGH